MNATGTVVLKSAGAISVAGDVNTTGTMLTIDGGPSVQVTGDVGSAGRVVVVGDTLTLRDVSSRNDIVLVARTGNLAGRTFTIGNPNENNNDAPVDGDGNAILHPLTGVALGELPGRKLVLLAGGEIIEGFTPIGEDSSDISASIVNLGNKNQTGALTVVARRITGGSISADQGVTLTTTGSNDAGPTPDGIYLGSVTASAGAVTLNSGLDIIVEGRTRARDGISMIAARDVRLGEDLNANQLSVDGDSTLTLQGGRRVFVETGIDADGIISITGGTDAMAAGAPDTDVDLAGVTSLADVTLTARRGLAADDVTTSGAVTASASHGNVLLGNLRGTTLGVTTAAGTGGSVTIASVTNGNANGGTSLTVSANTGATIQGAARLAATVQIDAADSISTGLVTAPTSIRMTSTGGDVTTGGLGGGSVALSGGTVAVNGTVGGSTLEIDARGPASITGAADMTGLIRITAGGAIETAALDSSTLQGITLSTTAGSIETGNVSGGVVTATAPGDITLASVTRGTDDGALSLSATSTTGSVGIAGTTRVTGLAMLDGFVNVGTGAVIAGEINFTARTGTITTGSLTGGPISLTATMGAVDVNGGTGGTSLLATAGGDIDIDGNSDISGTITLNAGGAVRTANLDSNANMDVRVTAAGGLADLGIVTGGTVVVQGRDGIIIDAVERAGGTTGAQSLSLTSGAGAVTVVGASRVMGGVIIDAATNVSTGLIAAGNIDLLARAGFISTGALTGGPVLLRAIRQAGASGDEGDVTVDGAIGGTSVTITADRDIEVTGATQVSGAVAMTAGGSLTAGTVDSTGNAAVTLRANGGDLDVGLLKGGALTVAATGNADSDGITSAASLDMTAGGTARLLGAATVSGEAKIAAGAISTQGVGAGSIAFTGVSSVDTGGLSAGSIDVRATGASGTVNVAGVSGSGTVLIQSLGSTTVGNIGATGAVTLRAGQVDGTAGSGDLQVGTIGNGTAAITLLATAGDINAGALAGGAIKADATGTGPDDGNISIASVNGASLEANASTAATLQADSTLTGEAKIMAGTIDTAAVTADSIVLTGASSVDTGTLSGTTIINVRSTDPGSMVNVAGVSGSGTVVIQSLGDMTVGNVEAIGNVTLRAGQVDDTAGSGDLQVGTIGNGTAPITLLATAGDINAGALTGGAIKADATGTGPDAGSITIASVNGSALDATASTAATLQAASTLAGQAKIMAGTIDTAAVTAGSIAFTGVSSVNTGTLSAGSVDVRATGDSSSVTLAGVSQSTGLAVAAGGLIALNGNVRTTGDASFTANRVNLANAAELRSDGRTTIKANSGTTAVNLANGADSLFDNEDMPRVFAASVQIDGNGRAVAIGTTNLFPNVVNVGVLTTGDIDVTGVLSFVTGTGAARTLTLGGEAVSDTGATATGAGLSVQARNLAVRVTNSGTPGGGQIVADGSAVRLNAQRVAVGLPTRFIDQLLPTPQPLAGTTASDEATTVRRAFTENPGSGFYQAQPPYSPAQYTVLKADRLVLRVQQWGLLQNTDTRAQPGGGAVLGNVQLFAAGGTGAPSGGPILGFFGTLGGQEGIAAALRVTVEQLGGISPNNVRINGCVALSTAGCIVTGLPLPLVQLNDPGRGLLIRQAPDLVLPVELISGTTNEALWRDDEDEPTPGAPASSGARP